MSTTQRRVAVIGAGLIGGSIAQALHAHPEIDLVVYDADASTRRRCQTDGLTVAASDVGAVIGADIVIIATPTAQLSQIIMDTYRRLKPNAVVMETGMVKTAPYNAAVELRTLRNDVHFVPITPMAGSEYAGYAHASPDLFVGAPFFVGNPHKDLHVVDAAVELVQALRGGTMHPVGPVDDHDAFIAVVSHAPQLLVAATTARLAGGSDARPVASRRDLDAALFDRVLRLAGSPRTAAAAAYTDNGEKLAAVLRRARVQLETVQFDLTDSSAMETHCDEARATRYVLEQRFPSERRSVPEGPEGHSWRVAEMMGFALLGAAADRTSLPEEYFEPLRFAGPAFGDSTALALQGIEQVAERMREGGLSAVHDYELAIRDVERSIDLAERVLAEFRGSRARTLPVVMTGTAPRQSQPRGGLVFNRCFDAAADAYARAQGRVAPDRAR